jgi:hypothetical protein
MAKRGEPLTEAQWRSFFQQDGRLIKEKQLRASVFRGKIPPVRSLRAGRITLRIHCCHGRGSASGGIDPAIRKEVWYFLLGYYPMHSTYRCVCDGVCVCV